LYLYHDRLPAPQAPVIVQQIYSMPPQAVGAYAAYEPAHSPMASAYQQQPVVMAKAEAPPVVMAYAAPVEAAPPRTAQVLLA
jgi:hypothetical protein